MLLEPGQPILHLFNATAYAGFTFQLSNWVSGSGSSNADAKTIRSLFTAQANSATHSPLLSPGIVLNQGKWSQTHISLKKGGGA